MAWPFTAAITGRGKATILERHHTEPVEISSHNQGRPREAAEGRTHRERAASASAHARLLQRTTGGASLFSGSEACRVCGRDTPNFQSGEQIAMPAVQKFYEPVHHNLIPLHGSGSRALRLRGSALLLADGNVRASSGSEHTRRRAPALDSPT